MPTSAPTSAPSEFWKQLGEEHKLLLKQHGLETMKQKQALRYFNWQWRLRTASKSEQLRFLLRSTRLTDWIRAGFASSDLVSKAWLTSDWSIADRWFYTFAIRLLWQYAKQHGDREVMALDEPSLGGPFPVRLAGRLISQDLANTALEVAAIRQAIGPTKPASIVEVGAGYGRTAHSLLQLFPDARYTIVDIEPAISISRWYLSTLFPNRDIRFVPALDAAQVSAVANESFDLALSISSLQEMTLEQVRFYLNFFDRTVRDGGAIFLKQWTEWKNPIDQIVLKFSEYPFPPRWVTVFDDQSPVQTQFRQRAWRVKKH